jgi:hypothetical protein
MLSSCAALVGGVAQPRVLKDDKPSNEVLKGDAIMLPRMS